MSHGRGEFYHFCVLFGIHSDGEANPNPGKFIHPINHNFGYDYAINGQQYRNNIVYSALAKAITEVFDKNMIRHEHSIDYTWEECCKEMRQAAVRILRHKRKQTKQKQKQISGREFNKTQSLCCDP